MAPRGGTRPQRGVKDPRYKAKKGTLPRLLKLLFKENKWRLIVVAICLFGAAFVSIFTSVFIKNFTDIVERFVSASSVSSPIYGQYSEQDAWADLGQLFLVLGSLYLTSTICSFIWNRMMAVITQRFLNSLRIKMFNHMESLPIKYFDRNAHGDIMSHFTNDTDSLRMLISQSIPNTVQTILTTVAIFVVMFTYSLWLTAVVILCVIAMLIVMKFVGGRSSRYFVKQQMALGKVEGSIEESINGLKVIKVFVHEEKSIEDFDKINNQLCEDATRANIYGNILMPIMANIGHIMYILLAIVGCALVIFKDYEITRVSLAGIREATEIAGTVFSFLSLSRTLGMQVSNFSQNIASITMGLAGASRIFDLLDEKPEEDKGYVTLVNVIKHEDGTLEETKERTKDYAWRHPHSADGTITYTELKGDITLNDVDFSYNGERLVLENVSVYAKPGQKIAFVGATGAGKTTITNLINRFYDIADGKIRYDGININKIKKDDLRKSLGIVLQDTNLFSGTVMENIRYGRLDATDEEVYAAAKVANAYDFITRLPNGFDTELSGDGANLSQGQRQLLSIARATIKDAPVMILDEATSSIDTHTEKLVQSGMDQLMKGRTTFVIAHRLSTVQDSQAIMVLDHGHIIERGTHDDLIKQKGVYYQLYTGSFELE